MIKRIISPIKKVIPLFFLGEKVFLEDKITFLFPQLKKNLSSINFLIIILITSLIRLFIAFSAKKHISSVKEKTLKRINSPIKKISLFLLLKSFQ